MAAKRKPCEKCGTLGWPMHFRAGLCRACQAVAAEALAEQLQKVLKQARLDFLAQCSEYGAIPLDTPARIVALYEAILDADTLPVGLAAAESAKKSAETWLLSEWGAGKIRGKPTVHSIEREAKSAEGLAKMLSAKGQQDAADRQLERAAELRDEAANLRVAKPKVQDFDWSSVPYGMTIHDEGDL